MATIEQIKAYWEGNTPQHWYSDKPVGTREYYDDIQRHRYGKVYPYLVELAGFKECAGKKVLEVGCGQGTDLLQFAKNGAEVYGIDLTDGAIQKASQMFAAYGLKAELSRQNSEDLSAFADATFDLVYSFGVIHHTPDTERALAEIRRVLKPGGRLCLMIYSKGFNFAVRLLYFHLAKGNFLSQSLQTTINQYTEYRRNSPLTKMYSRREALELVKDFEDVELYMRHNHHFVGRLPLEVRQLVEKRIGDNWFIRARKPRA